MDHHSYSGEYRKIKTPRRSTGGLDQQIRTLRRSTGDTAMKRKKRTYGNTSLVTITQRFVHLLMEAPGWRIDLNEAAKILNVEHSKRRLYDVTGVLLGASLVWKPLKNVIAWTGSENLDDHKRILKEVAALLEVEKRIDVKIEYMRQIINKIRPLDEAYVTKEDVAPLFKDKTVMFVRGSASTDLLVPTDSDSYMFSLKSPSDPINVFLFSDAEESSETVSERTSAGSVEVNRKEFHQQTGSNWVQALKEVGNINHYGSSFGDTASILLRGLDPGPFQERELSPRKPNKHPINFIPLEPPSNQSKPPIASYRAESALFRAPVER